MGKIHDPNVDAMFRNGQKPQQGAVIAQPINDIQMVAMLGAIIGASSGQEMQPSQAIAIGVELLAESAIQMTGGGFNNAIEAARRKREIGSATLIPTR